MLVQAKLRCGALVPVLHGGPGSHRRLAQSTHQTVLMQGQQLAPKQRLQLQDSWPDRRDASSTAVPCLAKNVVEMGDGGRIACGVSAPPVGCSAHASQPSVSARFLLALASSPPAARAVGRAPWIKHTPFCRDAQLARRHHPCPGTGLAGCMARR